MRSMHCLDCADDSHPRFRHPSSLRVEASLWAVAVLIGLSAGAWQALTESSDTAPNAVASALSIAAPASDATASPPAITQAGPRNVVLEVGDWLIRRMFGFLKVAWWAVPIPLAFSLWRQRTKYPVCAHCGSRRLIPAASVAPTLTG